MRTRIATLLLAALLLGSPAFGKTLSKVVAVVNNDIVSSYQLDKAVLEALARNAQGNQLTAEQFDQLRMSTLEKLINEKLVKQRIKELGLDVGEAELNAAIEDVQRKNNLTRPMLEQALRAQGMDFASYRQQLKDEILRYKLLGQEVNYKVQVTNSEIREYFRQHIEDYRAMPKIRVTHIVYQLPANAPDQQLEQIRKQAEVTRQLLLNGRELETVLADQGDQVTASDMGELVEDQLNEQLQIALAGLDVGDVSLPLEINQQLHLFQVTGRNPGDIHLFDRVKGEIEEVLKKEKTDLRFKEWAQELRDNGHVEIRI